MQLLRLTLTDFRSYAALTWRPHRRIAVLFGPNGSGKTNLLEAVSLLVPGRGLRNARNGDLKRHGAPNGWAVAGRFATAQGEADIGTGTPPDGPPDRRVFRLDGAAPRSQAEIAARVAAVWLTPQMDRLFLEGLAGRRRFLDRLVWALEPGHAREIAAYEAAMSGRNRLLAEGRQDPSWLAGLEDEMARHAVAATAARVALVGRLNQALQGGAVGAFPAARIDLLCPIADRLATEPAVAVEDWLRCGLAANRGRDAAAGTTALGAAAVAGPVASTVAPVLRVGGLKKASARLHGDKPGWAAIGRCGRRCRSGSPGGQAAQAPETHGKRECEATCWRRDRVSQLRLRCPARDRRSPRRNRPPPRTVAVHPA